MHWIQRHILKELAFADNKGNLFQYHARDLEKQGLIIRSGDGYALTPAGSHFVADLSQTKTMNRKTPPRVVVMISAVNGRGEQLFFK
jgi:ribosomal protein S19E (S16A)